MLIDEVCDALLPAAAGHSVGDVRVGLGYTAVQLDDGRCGLAYTFRDEIREGCCAVKAAGTLSGSPATDLAGWAKSSDPIAAAVGLAALNALIDVPLNAVEGDPVALLRIHPDDIIGMVGYFGPLIEALRSQGKALHVVERRLDTRPGVLHEPEANSVLPKCQIVVLSATALLNRTLDGLVDLTRTAR